MKLFSRGKDAEADAEAQNAEAGAAAAPPAQAQLDANAELTQAIDRSVKEISERITRLSSSVETVSQDKSEYDEKIARMEERMRKLTALTEVMSAQYNPFLGDEPPPETRVRPEREDDDAPDFAARAAPRGSAPFPPPPSPLHGARDDVEGEEDGGPMGMGLAEATELERDPFLPDFESGETRSEARSRRGHLQAIPKDFASAYLALNWCELLLEHAGRDALRDLLAYYEDVGWISSSVRDDVLRYARGILPAHASDAEDDSPEWRDWRADVRLHERSLLFIERLRGAAIDMDSIRLLRRDARWIGRGLEAFDEKPRRTGDAPASRKGPASRSHPKKRAARKSKTAAPKAAAPKTSKVERPGSKERAK